MELYLEQLQEQDIILLRDISDETSDIDLENIKAFLAEKQNIALVAKLSGKAIGLLYVYSVDIHTECREKGYGSQFMQLAIKWTKDKM